jgi:peptide/nickel transport system permease protein
MLMTAVRRIAVMIPLVIAMSIMVFGLVHFLPGDPAIAIAGDNPTPEQIEQIRERLGLDEPIVVQYLSWAGDALRGDFGTSLYSTASVGDEIMKRVPVSASLALAALAVSLVIAVPAGIIAALTRGRLPDRATTLLASTGIAIPNFWLGILLILVFAINRPWFPALGYVPFLENPFEWARHIALPAVTLGLAAAAETTRQLRSALYDVLQQDYIRTARAAGLPRWRVVTQYGLKNAAVPVVTVLGFQVAILLGGVVVIERIFDIPGLGALAVRAVLERDIPMVQGVVLVTALIVMTVNLVVDLSYAWLNPKSRK